MKRWSKCESSPIEDVIAEIAAIKKLPPAPKFFLPPGFAMTPIGPMPIKMRDEIEKRIPRRRRGQRAAWLKALR